MKHVKPGRWYQFRVAAVNENGTRGFSSPSQAFTTSHGPRTPGLPQNLTVDTIQYYNKTFNGILRWKPPLQSDLPIQKYKVYWSRRLKEVDQEQNSVLVNSQTVNKVIRLHKCCYTKKYVYHKLKFYLILSVIRTHCF